MNIGSPSQPTDFLLDMPGRRICNTSDKSLADSQSSYCASNTPTHPYANPN